MGYWIRINRGTRYEREVYRECCKYKPPKKIFYQEIHFKPETTVKGSVDQKLYLNEGSKLIFNKLGYINGNSNGQVSFLDQKSRPISSYKFKGSNFENLLCVELCLLPNLHNTLHYSNDVTIEFYLKSSPITLKQPKTILSARLLTGETKKFFINLTNEDEFVIRSIVNDDGNNFDILSRIFLPLKNT